MKKKMLMSILLIVAIVIGLFFYMKVSIREYDLKLNNENEYVIETNLKWLTMQNDGGSHTSIYYKVDLNDNIVIKFRDEYVGFEGYEYQGKILYEKELSESEKAELSSIIENAINNKEKEDELNYNYYLISSLNNEDVKIYDNTVINRIEKILEQK